jgi:hypothetical protein
MDVPYQTQTRPIFAGNVKRGDIAALSSFETHLVENIDKTTVFEMICESGGMSRKIY